MPSGQTPRINHPGYIYTCATERRLPLQVVLDRLDARNCGTTRLGPSPSRRSGATIGLGFGNSRHHFHVPVCRRVVLVAGWLLSHPLLGGIFPVVALVACDALSPGWS
ncbi:hypothetical protein P8C59_004644 [Phyllachora maydis]|uniref:Uncharacterized protein n=1 Tax=Phyllachora maydis TaxID=1825666 RepID=A0AAD9I2T7_9PEZI|nr:hypothetical protein P8C59_004644 [Phyllachora maydis]